MCRAHIRLRLQPNPIMLGKSVPELRITWKRKGALGLFRAGIPTQFQIVRPRGFHIGRHRGYIGIQGLCRGLSVSMQTTLRLTSSATHFMKDNRMAVNHNPCSWQAPTPPSVTYPVAVCCCISLSRMVSAGMPNKRTLSQRCSSQAKRFCYKPILRDGRPSLLQTQCSDSLPTWKEGQTTQHDG